NGRLMAYLEAHGEVLSKKYHDTRAIVHCRIPQRYLGRIEEDGIVVRRHQGDGGRWASSETIEDVA
ncbi:MAG: GTPase HflX, partial [Planctomycetota bacterium]